MKPRRAWTPPRGIGSRCAAALRSEREDIVSALAQANPGARENRFGEPPDVFRQRLGESVELLARHLDGDACAAALYAGLRIFELHRPERDRKANLTASRESVDHDWEMFRGSLASRLKPEELSFLHTAYGQATEPLRADAARHVRTLFIGDCLMTEIMSFLVAPLLAEGISIDAFPINSSDPVRLRKGIAELAARDYDVVFFSPFAHARLPEMWALLDPRNAFARTSRIDDWIDTLVVQTESLLEVVSERFDCPVFVHNASMTRRSSTALKATLGAAASARARTRAKRRLNAWLGNFMRKKNAETHPHLFVLDEDAVARTCGGPRAGLFLYESPFMHATTISVALAGAYRSRIGAIARLADKKLVVCDLDNTLWDGLIGEGAVRQLPARQRALKRLKDECGVVLSIASKNDPGKVQFAGAVLAAGDFVAPQIGWEPKSVSIGRILRQLNLQSKHMVFLDDRPDERALAHTAFPDALVLDPTDEAVWERISLWSDLKAGSSEVDRTRFYQEQIERDRTTRADDDTGASRAEALERLDLTFTISTAGKRDLKRFVELVNRTNQWNLTGARTTFQQASKWHASEQYELLQCAASDRFGDMGTVCLAVVDFKRSVAEIPVFVLSCRVFGYGAETAMLGEIQRRCQARGIDKVVGMFQSTGQNHLARDMYPAHGFTQTGDRYELDCEAALPLVPWATILTAGSDSFRARSVSRGRPLGLGPRAPS